MKKFRLVSAMLALVMVFGLAFVGCGSNANTDPKSVTITGIPADIGVERGGVWVFARLPQGNASPINTAIQSGSFSGSTITLNLVVPRDNTWNSGPAWTGNGNYYVALVPIINNGYNYSRALLFTNGGETPVKVAFDQANITLEFSKFK